MMIYNNFKYTKMYQTYMIASIQSDYVTNSNTKAAQCC